jgi:hypothetical protein
MLPKCGVVASEKRGREHGKTLIRLSCEKAGASRALAFIGKLPRYRQGRESADGRRQGPLNGERGALPIVTLSRPDYLLLLLGDRLTTYLQTLPRSTCRVTFIHITGTCANPAR